VTTRLRSQTLIEPAALDEDEQAALWLLAWSLPPTPRHDSTLPV